jgi:hypothetical protein
MAQSTTVTTQTTTQTPSSQVCCPSPSSTGGTTSGGGGGFAADIEPYVGYVWPNSFTGIGDFKGTQMYGIRGGLFVTSGFEIGANYHWNPHFQPSPSQPAPALAGDLGFPQAGVRGNLWEVELTYNFGSRSMFGGHAFRPYIVGGAGGITTTLNNGDAFVLNTNESFVPGATPADLRFELANNDLQRVLPGINTSNGVAFVGTPTGTSVFVPNDVIHDNHPTFFTFSYGVGAKAAHLWGPLGFFGDIRGRTTPNFFGHSNTWPEVSAGLNFSFGER